MLQPGQVLHERYQLKQKLGQTAGRQTWLAEDCAVEPGEKVVVKLLAFGDEAHWDELKLFEREAQVLRQLDHPQIPKYRDFFSIDDRVLWFGLVQDCIPGSSLKQLLAQGKHFSPKQVQQMAVNLLHLLMYLHELSPPVLHRDLKPSNLILGEDGFIYLIDFGAVQDKSAAEGATFTVVGTYGYAPLEQFGGRAVPASDLYALGATLIHLLTGVSPAELPQENLRIQFSDRVSLDPHFVQWIEKLTDPDVSKRFPTARQALDALRSPEVFPSTPPEKPTLARSSNPPRSIQSAPAQLTPPYDTQIELNQTAEQLLIKLPGTQLWNLLWLVPLGIFVIYTVQVLFPPFILLSLGLGELFIVLLVILFISFFVYWDYLPTYVQLDRRRFFIYKRPFGFSLAMVEESTAGISNIFHTLKTFHTGKTTYEKRVVVIQSMHGENVFGKGLSWDECAWLVDVMKDWLGLR